MAKAATLNIDIVASAEKATQAFDSVKEKAGSAFGGMKVAALGAATVVLGALGDATKAAAEHQVAVSKLQQAYKDAGVPAGEMNDALEDIDKSSRRTGQSAEDNIAAYTKLITVTHDSAAAHEDLATAQDLAAYKGVSVASAADAIAKASQGNTRALKDMGIATTDAAGKQLSHQAVMEKLTAAVHGQADAFGNTAVGQMARYKESMDQAKVEAGSALLPALQAIISMLQPLFSWLSKNTAIIKVLAPILAAAAAAVYGVVLAQRAWVAIQTVLNAVMSANPIGLVVLAIAGLVVGIVLAYNHFKIVRDIVNDVWGVLRSLGAWIAAHWKLIIDILLGPIGVLFTNLSFVKNLIDDIVRALEDVGNAVSKALGWLGKLPKSAGSLIGKLNPFSASAAPPGATTMVFQITALPGDRLPEVVYDALKSYQRRHVRPELVPLFAGR